MRSDGFRPWRLAMADALYGDAGFYRASGAPGRHFRTAAHTSGIWAECWLRFASTVAADVARGFTVVDMGAGGGELIGGLAALAPAEWRLVGVDVAPRPAGLPARVEWLPEPPSSFAGLAIAVEWLDVVPLDVVELAADGPRLVEVDPAGTERLGPVVDDEWQRRWWPLREVGDRAEIGTPRDEAWRSLVGRLTDGVAVAVDYAADPAHHSTGTLTGYRDGRQVKPVPDGSCDLTAHVFFESLGGTPTTQREALQRLGLTARVPAYGGDPAAYAAALQRVSAEAELIDPHGLGGFTWLVQRTVGDSPS